MGATHKVRWKVSATPIVEVSAAAGDNLATTTLHEDIRKSVGGSGEITNDGNITYGGWNDGSNDYLQATGAGITIGDGTSEFIWIKHTGYEWSNASTLGDATNDTVLVYADSEHTATLGSGEAWVIPLAGTSTNVIAFKVRRGGSTDIAIEALELD